MENFEDIDGKPPDTGLPELTGYDDFSTMEVSGLPAGEKKQSGVLEETSAIKEEFHQPPPHEFGDTNTDVDILACDEGDSQPQSSGPPSQDLRPAPGEEKIEDMSDGPEAEMSVSDSEENEKEPLSYELQQGFRILREIMSDGNKSLNWPFMEPVDSEGMGLQDYASRIKEPMWLKKSKALLEFSLFKKLFHKEYFHFFCLEQLFLFLSLYRAGIPLIQILFFNRKFTMKKII